MPPQSDSYFPEGSRRSADVLKTPVDILRHSSPFRTSNSTKPLSSEQRTSAARSIVSSYQTSPSAISYGSRRQSPARTRSLEGGGLADASERPGIRVADPGTIRVTDASKSSLRSKSPYSARTYQTSGSPYLATVHFTPSQRSSSVKGRSVSRERGARMSTGKQDGVNEGRLAANPHVTASEPTSPTAAVGPSMRRMASLKKAGEGKGYLDRLGDELATSMRVQTADPSRAEKRGLESGYGAKQQTRSSGPSLVKYVSVGAASRTLNVEKGDMSNWDLNQGRSTTLNQIPDQDRSRVLNPILDQERVSLASIGDRTSAQQRSGAVAATSIRQVSMQQHREEALLSKRPSSAGLASQRTETAADGKHGPGGARAERRKQSGLDSFAEISVSVGELLKSHGADVSKGGGEPIRRKVADASPSLSESLNATASRTALRRSPVGGEEILENIRGVKGETWNTLASRGVSTESSPLSSPSTSAGTPTSSHASFSPGAGANRRAGGGAQTPWGEGEQAQSGFRQTKGQVSVKGVLPASNLSSETWGAFERGQRTRAGVCTADNSDDVSGGKKSAVGARTELTLDDISLSSSSGESKSSSEAEGDFNPRRGRGARNDARADASGHVSRTRGDVSGAVSSKRGDEVSRIRADVSGHVSRTRGDVSIRVRDDVSSDVSSSEIRSPDSFGSASPRDLLTPDSLLSRRPAPSDERASWGGLDFRIDPPPQTTETPPRRKSARIVPLCDNSIPRPIVGLRNLGNTCFLNSILQCLISTPPLLAALAALQDDALQQAVDCENVTGGASTGRGGSPRPRLVGPLVRLLRGMTGARAFTALSPEEFLGRLERWAPQFADGDQHDSQEALRIIMEALDLDCSRVKAQPPYRELASTGAPPGKLAGDAWSYHRSRHDSVIQDIFSGQLQSTVECRDCGLQSHCFDPFLDLSLPLPKPSKAAASERDAGSWFSPGRSVSLQQCLAAFTAEEDLEEDHSCEWCKAPRPATKKLAIFQLPRVLVLHIKRISGARFSLFSKDSTAVDFPLTGLDVRTSTSKDASPGQASDSVYDLVAVSNHSGSMTGGHYTAYCKETASQNATWHCYNDSSVSEVAPSQVVSSSAYVLFYQKRSNAF